MNELVRAATNLIVPGMLSNNLNEIRQRRIEQQGYSQIEQEAIKNMGEQTVSTISRSMNLLYDLLPFSLITGATLEYIGSGRFDKYILTFAAGLIIKAKLVDIARECNGERIPTIN